MTSGKLSAPQRTMLDKRLVQKHFDRHAATYDDYSGLQRAMGERLLERIGQRRKGKGFRRILEIGCGTGNLTRVFAHQFPPAERIVALDLAPAMITAAKAKLGRRAEQVLFLAADAEEAWASLQANVAAGFDLIVSNAAFQWFNEPEQTIPRYAAMLAPGGMLAFSTFGPDTFGELHHAFALAEQDAGRPAAQHGQIFPALALWQSFFPAGRFVGWEERETRIYPEVADFLRSIRKIGAANAVKTSNAALSLAAGKLLQGMMRHYEQSFAAKGGVMATYHMLYGLFER